MKYLCLRSYLLLLFLSTLMLGWTRGVQTVSECQPSDSAACQVHRALTRHTLTTMGRECSAIRDDLVQALERMSGDIREEMMVALNRQQETLRNISATLEQCRGKGGVQICNRCPPGYSHVSAVNRCYKIISTSVTWTPAFLACARDPGAYLVAIETEKEWNAINEWLQGKPKGRFWTGARKTDTSGTWRWVTSSQPLTFARWCPTQPDNNGGIEECIDVSTESWYCKIGAAARALNDAKCDNNLLGYICESSPTCSE